MTLRRTTFFATTLVAATSWFAVTVARAETLETPDDVSTGDETLLLADEIEYDNDANLVTARGYVEIQRGDRLLLADMIVYDRARDIATATGHVSLLDGTGTVLYVDKIEVSGDLKQGLADEVRVLLSDKSRMASRAFRRIATGVNELYQAVYTPCDSCGTETPIWQIKADRVRYDRDAQMVYYNDAWLEIGGVPVFYSPYLAHPDPTSGAKTGLLLPSIGASRNLGVFYKQPYFVSIASDRDATLTPFLTTNAGQGAILEYRQNFASARLRMDGSVIGNDPDLNKDLRGHFKGSLRWDLDRHWRTGTDLDFASDRTYLRRYAFDAPTWLTSNFFTERFSAHSYFAANAYYFQRQRAPVLSSSVPKIAPLLDYGYVSDPDALGGYWTADANALVLFRRVGTDSNRLSTRIGWNLPYTSSFGAVYTLRAGARADGYYVRDVLRPRRGDVFTGTAGRFVPEISAEWRLPLVSDDLGFHQVLEPIAMITASPHNLNPEAIANEDGLDIEFDDTNLFGMNRFSGFDRVETGVRVNYGVRWTTLNASVGTISALVGQSYRFHDDPAFSRFSGLSGHASDYVGHVNLSPNPYFNFAYRFRLDRNSLASRRGEVLTSAGPDLFRVGAGYLFVKSDGTQPTNPGATEELFLTLSSRLSQRWSLVANHRHNLGRGGGSIRTDIGITYEDECFIFGLDFANDRTQDRDFKRGVAVLLRLSLKTIGDIKFNTDIGARR